VAGAHLQVSFSNEQIEGAEIPFWNEARICAHRIYVSNGRKRIGSVGSYRGCSAAEWVAGWWHFVALLIIQKMEWTWPAQTFEFERFRKHLNAIETLWFDHQMDEEETHLQEKTSNGRELQKLKFSNRTFFQPPIRVCSLGKRKKNY
jgi:hypothetical protein